MRSKLALQFKGLNFETLEHLEFGIDKVRIYNILMQSFRLALARITKQLYLKLLSIKLFFKENHKWIKSLFT